MERCATVHLARDSPWIRRSFGVSIGRHTMRPLGTPHGDGLGKSRGALHGEMLPITTPTVTMAAPRKMRVVLLRLRSAWPGCKFF